MNYFLFNKALDYRRGCGWNVETADEGIRMKDGPMGFWVSRRLDSLEAETRWHRLRLESHLGENMTFTVHIYGTDRPDQAGEIDEVLEAGSLSAKEAIRELSQYEMAVFQRPEDVLLHEVRCRYLWLGIHLWGSRGEGPRIGGIQIWFPAESWIFYLPEYYQGQKSTFLERYLSVFQTMYGEREEKIRKSAGMLDLGAVDREGLLCLASWLDMPEAGLWETARLRRYLSHGAAVYRFHGTRRGLELVTRLFTGVHPFIVEGEPYRFTMYLLERAVPSMREYRAFIKVIREEIPAGMELSLVLLKPRMLLNQDSYVGINSVISGYPAAVLDGVSGIGLAVLGGRNK